GIDVDGAVEGRARPRRVDEREGSAGANPGSPGRLTARARALSVDRHLAAVDPLDMTRERDRAVGPLLGVEGHVDRQGAAAPEPRKAVRPREEEGPGAASRHRREAREAALAPAAPPAPAA